MVWKTNNYGLNYDTDFEPGMAVWQEAAMWLIFFGMFAYIALSILL